MKLTHRIPAIEPESAVLDAAYELEVIQSTLRGVRATDRAYRGLWRAQSRLRKALAQHDKRQIKIAWEAVELRREELAELERQMMSAPASASHRGAKSFRPVPITP